MEYGFNINYFARTIGMKKAAELIAKAGFTCLDYTPSVMEDNWEQDMKEFLKIFADYGLTVHQTHAPFNRYGRYKGMHKLCLDRCAEATAFMGAKYMVTHGDEFDFDNLTFSPEAAKAYNHDLFLPYVEHGEKNGYKVAFETLFEDWDRRRYTSDAGELLDLITSFDNENVVCCWDSGHGNVSFGHKAPELIKKFGSLIQCTHIHDNVGIDSHQLPMTGSIDWKAFSDAFKAIGYHGIISIEYSHGNMPEHLVEDFAKLTYQTVKHIWSL